MFTGLVETVGCVVATERRGGDFRFRVDLGPAGEDVALGASIALDGCCQTVAALEGRLADFDAVPETLERTTLGSWTRGRRVNVERSLRLGDRLGGHLVQGHVDGVGTVVASGETARGWRLRVRVPSGLRAEIAPKGSIAISGVSLTVAETGGDEVAVALIPTTLAETNLGDLAPGDAVNIETDMLAKYVRQAMEAATPARADDDRLRDTLRRAGYTS